MTISGCNCPKCHGPISTSGSCICTLIARKVRVDHICAECGDDDDSCFCGWTDADWQAFAQ